MVDDRFVGVISTNCFPEEQRTDRVSSKETVKKIVDLIFTPNEMALNIGQNEYPIVDLCYK